MINQGSHILIEMYPGESNLRGIIAFLLSSIDVKFEIVQRGISNLSDVAVYNYIPLFVLRNGLLNANFAAGGDWALSGWTALGGGQYIVGQLALADLNRAMSVLARS